MSIRFDLKKLKWQKIHNAVQNMLEAFLWQMQCMRSKSQIGLHFSRTQKRIWIFSNLSPTHLVYQLLYHHLVSFYSSNSSDIVTVLLTSH